MKKSLLFFSLPKLLIILILFSNCSNRDEYKITHFNDVPEWSKNVVWYQIFVERFRNGDTTNDPTPDDIDGTYPGIIPSGWKVTPWTQDWYKPDEYFKELEGMNDNQGNPIQSFGQKAQLRRYGGDLQGVLDKIDYLDSLGVTAIYFNPLNDAPSLHKYDARNWRHIDRNLGPSPRQDVKTMSEEIPDDPTTWKLTEADKMFLMVIEEFHRRDIKVILDFSWNHTGNKFWAWENLVEKGEKSKYKDWYWVKEFDDPTTDENEFEYRGWFGVAELPEIKETEYHDHLLFVKSFDGDLVSKEAKQHIFNITKRWLDPNNDGDPSDGVDGFRLDVAAELPLTFWREYRKIVRDVNPNAYLVGEIWWEQYPDRLLDPKEFLEGDIFDAVMNYRWYRIARHFFNDSPDEMLVSVFADSLKKLTVNLREQNNYAMMNLVASHDVPRVATSLYNKNKYKYESTVFANENYKINKPDEATYNTLKLLLAHQFTYIGAPHIWGGDEMGMWGGDDPDTRKPLIWPDYNFEDESVHPLDMERPTDKVEFNSELYSYYRKLIQLRNSNSVLRNGKIDFVKVDDEKQILAYSRFDDKEEAIILFNNGTAEQKVELPKKFSNELIDVLSSSYITNTGQNVVCTLKARGCAILISHLNN